MTVRAGGIFLLQENEPVRLLASMASIVTDARLGTVRIGFDEESGFFRSSDDGADASIVLDSKTALSFAGLLHVVVAQSRWMRGGKDHPGAPCPSVVPRGVVVRREPRPRGRTVCSWPVPTDGIELIHVPDSDGQLELRFREDVARGVADAIVDELGRFSAWPLPE